MESSVTITLEVSPALNEKLRHLAKANNTDLDTVLLKALALYEVASQAKQENRRLAILDANQHLVAEVTGI
jgi:predicted transcriptional regulator